jgi:hypothetical protein
MSSITTIHLQHDIRRIKRVCYLCKVEYELTSYVKKLDFTKREHFALAFCHFCRPWLKRYLRESKIKEVHSKTFVEHPHHLKQIVKLLFVNFYSLSVPGILKRFHLFRNQRPEVLSLFNAI